MVVTSYTQNNYITFTLYLTVNLKVSNELLKNNYVGRRINIPTNSKFALMRSKIPHFCLNTK